MIGWLNSTAFLAMALVCAQNAAAAGVPPAFAYVPAAAPVTADSASLLTLPEAMRLALVDQPLLTSRQARIEAERQQAISAAQ